MKKYGFIFFPGLAFSGIVIILMSFSGNILDHNMGTDCMGCHYEYDLAGTVFTDSSALTIESGVDITLIKPDGTIINAGTSNADGNIAIDSIGNGIYLMKVGNIMSRTWHTIPDQGSCNTCHIAGGNASSVRTKRFSQWHTRIPEDNNCSHCHYYPQTMHYASLICPNVINTAAFQPPVPDSYVLMQGQSYLFDPSQNTITTTRPDIFAPGYYSAFDVILAVFQQNSIPVEYEWDSLRKTHFITKINNGVNNFWYHWSYDIASGNTSELNYKRANRWDELLWRPGLWIKIVAGEDLTAIKSEYLDEISRENSHGHVIPNVRIDINPSSYNGNPPGSGRVTASLQLSDIRVTPHNRRAAGYPSPYSKPFNPGVVTSMDILYSLMDSLILDSVYGAFYTHFNTNYIESFYIVSMGIPGVGLAHSSGRQGFVYITENGSFSNLPNNADNKLHVTSDIHVIHAPDFSYWRWIELGNPYYENQLSGIDESVAEDYACISLGFNLHDPFPNPFTGEVNLSYNIFYPGQHASIMVYDSGGRIVEILYDDIAPNIGIHKIKWNAENYSSGTYFIRMHYNDQQKTRKIVLMNK